ncbi:MAG: DNA polymerase IV, partial [Lachnospiraceae bacterium]|nr:DNA polymerase IV [Lachnospiraceae bacterium]
MNNFFASVECRLDPTIKNKPVAVCGSKKERHGIVLARNDLAKKYAVRTGDTIWQAKSKCPDIHIASPPHYESYHYFSDKAKEIYLKYTDMVEPYGIDECWLDVTNSQKLFGSGEKMANELREKIKKELGLTISVGVSFNKVFAKLGSDMKKPDGTTVISKENYKEKVWKLPASYLLGVGRNVKKTLDEYFIRTIGDIANTKTERLEYILGKNGSFLHDYANGIDDVEIAKYEDYDEVKSIGHGTTTVRDLENEEEVWNVIFSLTKEIGAKLRENGLKAKGVSIVIKDNTLDYVQFRKKISTPTQSALVIAKEANDLFLKKYLWDKNIRSVTVTAIDLIEENEPIDQSIFMDIENVKKIEKVEKMIGEMQDKYAEDVIN